MCFPNPTDFRELTLYWLVTFFEVSNIEAPKQQTFLICGKNSNDAALFWTAAQFENEIHWTFKEEKCLESTVQTNGFAKSLSFDLVLEPDN